MPSTGSNYQLSPVITGMVSDGMESTGFLTEIFHTKGLECQLLKRQVPSNSETGPKKIVYKDKEEA